MFQLECFLRVNVPPGTWKKNSLLNISSSAKCWNPVVGIRMDINKNSVELKKWSFGAIKEELIQDN